MKKIFILLPFISALFGQVCCSLVGAVNSNASSVISAHYPSKLDFNQNVRWNVGLLNSINLDNSRNIKYPFANNGYLEVSGYLTDKIVWFINTSISFTSIEEKVSFEQSSTYVVGAKARSGFRKELNYNLGLAEGTLTLPLKPYYSNESFPFKTGVVPTYSINWIKRNFFNNSFNILFGIDKNIQEKSNVFIDNEISMVLWKDEQIFNFYISPYLSIQHQKLLAPLTPFEDSRDTRYLGFIYLGINLIPLNPQIDFFQINLNIPIYSWVSKIGFPDGTAPNTSLSISVFSNGLFKKDTKPNIFN